MSTKGKTKHGTQGEPWWRSARSFSYEGHGSVETFIALLQNSYRYEANMSVHIDEIDAGQEYHFVVGQGQRHKKIAMQGRVSKLPLGRFEVEGTSFVVREGTFFFGWSFLFLVPILCSMVFSQPLITALGIVSSFALLVILILLLPFYTREKHIRQLKHMIQETFYANSPRVIPSPFAEHLRSADTDSHSFNDVAHPQSQSPKSNQKRSF